MFTWLACSSIGSFKYTKHRLSLDESLESLTSPMEPHLDRVGRDREALRSFVGIKFLDVAQQEDGSILVRKSLDEAPHNLARIATFKNILDGFASSFLTLDPLSILVKAR